MEVFGHRFKMYSRSNCIALINITCVYKICIYANISLPELLILTFQMMLSVTVMTFQFKVAPDILFAPFMF